jgi:hypothetical protein
MPTTERTPIAMNAREKTSANFFCLTRKSKKASILNYCFLQKSDYIGFKMKKQCRLNENQVSE